MPPLPYTPSQAPVQVNIPRSDLFAKLHPADEQGDATKRDMRIERPPIEITVIRGKPFAFID
jgi:hypothetical protein